MIVAYAKEGLHCYPTDDQIKSLKKNEYDLLIVGKENSDDSLMLLLKTLNHGDTLLVHQLACFGLTQFHLLDFFEKLGEKEISLISLSDELQLPNLKNSEFMDYLYLIVNTEKKVKSNLTLLGIQSAKEKGRVGGRPTIPKETIKKIKELNHYHHYSYRQIASMCNVSLGAVHKYAKKDT